MSSYTQENFIVGGNLFYNDKRFLFFLHQNKIKIL